MSIAFLSGAPGGAGFFVVFVLLLIVPILIIAAVANASGGNHDADERIAALERRVDELEDEQ
ncbi:MULTISPECIES: hypothetical protein [Natrialba]|uniref:Uncharacterized protein n=2 Tax=Natrialba TaxID=63742 RepID=M0BM29_9EURY|nr:MULTISPECIES: hypothetical protein [Natrialba]ELY87249.1 hypothetical protein C484_17851 [Natrialba taiwanensis DSM 12281]ELZ11512.1 hypothetical protein C480_00417 [Natrialba aegyptia DSM 13077]